MAKFTLVEDDEAPVPMTMSKGQLGREPAFTVVSEEPEAKLAAAPMTQEEAAQITSFGNRLKRGFMNPFHGAAQALMHALPEDTVTQMNELANKIGGPGTFLGSIGIQGGPSTAEFDKQLADEQARYDQAAKMSNPGFDVAGILGEAASPPNLAMGLGAGKGLAAEGAKKAAVKLGLIGGAAAGLQPVTSGDAYAEEKAGQVATGAATGAILGPIIQKAGNALTQYVSNKLSSGVVKPAIGVENEVRQALAKDGVDFDILPESTRFEMVEKVRQALTKGQDLDMGALARQADFERQGMKGTLGQITRDPSQYSRELNLRRVQGVGEPLNDRLAQQQQQINEKFDRLTSGAKGDYEAGVDLIKNLESRNLEMQEGIRKAYSDFKKSTGTDLKVPSDELAAKFREVMKEYGPDVVPGAVKARFKELGILDEAEKGVTKGILGPDGKVLSNVSMTAAKPVEVKLEDAERLLQTINRHYDPLNAPKRGALNALTDALKKTIENGANTAPEGSLTRQLAETARATARERFKAIEDSPAFKAVIRNSANPDDFVRKYVVNGKNDEIAALMNQVTPETKKQMQVQFMRHLQKVAFGANAAGDGATRQNNFNQALQNIGIKKLETILGKEQADDLMSLGRVMAYIQQRPAGAAINESGSAAEVVNLLKRGTNKIPYVGEILSRAGETRGQRKAVESALTASLPGSAKKSTEIDPKAIRALSRLLGLSTVAIGASIGQQ